jgi:hypothetical protein
MLLLAGATPATRRLAWPTGPLVVGKPRCAAVRHHDLDCSPRSRTLSVPDHFGNWLAGSQRRCASDQERVAPCSRLAKLKRYQFPDLPRGSRNVALCLWPSPEVRSTAEVSSSCRSMGPTPRTRWPVEPAPRAPAAASPGFGWSSLLQPAGQHRAAAGRRPYSFSLIVQVRDGWLSQSN